MSEPDRFRYFRLEARELLDQFGDGVRALERGATNGTVPRLLRLAHTLKGASRVVRLPEIADRAHAIEDALSPFRDAGAAVPRDRIATVLKSLGEIAERVAEIDRRRDAEAAPDRRAVDEPYATVRADLAEMDAVLDGIGEIHTLLGGVRRAAGTVEEAQRLAELLADQLARRQAGAAEQSSAVADELRAAWSDADRRLDAALDRIDRELRRLRDAAERLRLVPAAALFIPLERAAHDAAQALGREVAFSGSGGDIRLDAHLLGPVQNALVQLVRNAVAHGIEAPAARSEAGKPRAGRVAVAVSRRGSRIVFACRDDGRGIDLDAVRQAAIRRGLSAAAARASTVEGVVGLLLRGGISTAAAVTEISGRGIGLDVVREAVDGLGGTIAVETRRGSGTEFTLAVPLSLAAIEGLSAEGAGNIATIPLDAVRGIVRLRTGEISRLANGAAVEFAGQTVPFVALPRLLGGAAGSDGKASSVVIVGSGERIAAIGVDRLGGTAAVAMRPLPEWLPPHPLVSGASLDPEGRPRLVLDPEGLVAAAYAGDAATPAEPTPTARLPVLVVDDSLTTRMLEQSILEAAGYQVELATSAEEALEIARRQRFSLFLVDVEMPGMDGFAFVEQTRGDPMLRGIPAILVTSRNAPEDLRRGRDAGASGYIVKSEFDQAELLSLIRPLIG